ncbi:MAG: 3-hydroxybutyrate dehydrogenase [Fusobacteria bacterium]|nr:3-hydroxybutyrate dehydrogenase [Fusobacteriota bacterium]
MITMDMTGKVALITGSTKGIGKGVAELFAKSGANVVVVGRNQDEANAVAKEISEKFGKEALGLKMDVSVEAEITAGFKKITEKFGRLDALINNAGIQIIKPFDEFDFENEWKKLMSINVDGVFLASKEAFKIMKTQPAGGKIITIGSIHSFLVSPNKGAYCTAKHALLGMTRSIAKDGGKYNIAANLVGPAFVLTDLVRNQIKDRVKFEGLSEEEVMKAMVKDTVDSKFTTEEEVASLCLFLASAPGNAYTGQSMMVSHGWGMQ